jgi:hypothetical protein
MIARPWTTALAALCVASASAALYADDTQKTPQQLQQEVEQLRAAVKELQAQRVVAPAYTAGDVDATVDSVLHDSARRSQLLAETGGFMGGWMDDKFTIRSEDGNYSMSPGIQFQFRSVTNYNQNANNGKDNTDNGFEARRLKFSLDGTAITKNLYYAFVWATDRKTGNLVNEEAWVQYKFADNFSLKAGQYKELIYEETAVSSKRKLAVDVSLAAQVLFAGDVYSQGVELNYDDHNAIRAMIGFSDGYGSVNTNFQDPPTNPFDFGVYGRIDYKVFGDWKSYADQTALGNKHDLLVIGAGGDWSQNGDMNVYRHAIDGQWEVGPAAIYGAFVGRYTDTIGSASNWDWAIVAQIGYMLNAQWEVFGRYDYLKLDNVSSGSEDTFHEVTVGLNYYIKAHTKVTLDFGWLPNGSPSNLDAIGVLSNNGDNEYYIRGQFQLLL